MNQRKLIPQDVDRIAELDAARREYFVRHPDRPDGRFVKARGRVPPEVRRAQGRLRTDHWRTSMDRKCRPTASQVGLALAVALATSNLSDLTGEDRGLVQRALADLKARGFDVDQALLTMRRLRNRLVDPADREGEPAS